MLQTVVASAAFAIVIAGAIAWRHWLAPAVGAAEADSMLLATGTTTAEDLTFAGHALWRPMITILAVMTLTACAQALGILERLALVVEPRTRGPVRHAFRLVFALSALTSTVLSNDAAILLLTPTVIALLRQVYPRRHPKFVVPFAFAVFAAAGVAPLLISNPMNLVVAERAGIHFNAYALQMVPIAVAGWVVTYLVLAHLFRDQLADEAPALGAAPPAPPPLAASAAVVLVLGGLAVVAYPVVSYFGGPLWIVAATTAALATVATCSAGISAKVLSRSIGWEIFPFLAAVFLAALALEHVGAVAQLAEVYRAATWPIPTIGVTSALGSALLNNHPMAVLNSAALATQPHTEVLAALIGGDLGPRLLPTGSLAGLLWLHALRREQVAIPVRQFLRVGALTTAPALIVSLVLLWLLQRCSL
jgi:arsenical pump membrane protein